MHVSDKPSVCFPFWRLSALLLAGLLSACSGTSLVPDTFDVLPAQVNGGNGRAFHAAVSMPNRDILLIGGQDAAGNAITGTQFAERLPSAAGSFIPETDYTSATGRVNGAAVTNGQWFLSTGGQSSGIASGGAASAPTWLPDTTPAPNGELYQPLSSFPLDLVTLPAGANGGALVMVGSEAFLIGGRDTANGVSAAIYRFSGNAVVGFVHVADLNWAREGHTATLLADGTILVVGGFNAAGQVVTAAEIFDPDPTALTTVDLPSGPLFDRALHTATASADRCSVLIYGGVSTPAGQPVLVDSPELFRAQSGFNCTGNNGFAVVPAPGLITSRVYHSATLLQNGDILITGGVDDNFGHVTGSAQVFSPTFQTLRETVGPLGFPRFGHSSTVMVDGTVFIAGGLDSGFGAVLPTERYVPESF